MKENKKEIYIILCVNNRLKEHLICINNEAEKRVKTIINEMCNIEKVDEKLKENNPNNNMPKVFATSLICDSKSGKPLALLNAAPITSFRTGAAAGIGAKYLARKDSENLLVVSCGNIAIYSIAAVLITMPNIKNVYICNPKNHKSVLNTFEDIKKEVPNTSFDYWEGLIASAYEFLTDEEYWEET